MGSHLSRKVILIFYHVKRSILANSNDDLIRFVSTARGEQEYFDPNGVATATEGSKSNALMRCCKDLGIAHELWSPRFIRDFKTRKCVEVFVEHAATHKK